MALLADPFDALLSLQQALDAFRASGWLGASPSGGGAYPPVNVFRKGDDYVLIAEVPGVRKADLEVMVTGNTLHLAGTKSVDYPQQASLHRRERARGRFARAVTLPIEIDAEGVKAECHDGVLALYLPRPERDKPKLVKVN
jgi:HSP20 family protein